MPFRKYFMLSLFFVLNVAAYSQAKNKKLIRVLIVDGYSNHDWNQTTTLTKRILEESKLFNVTITTAPATTNEDSL